MKAFNLNFSEVLTKREENPHDTAPLTRHFTGIIRKKGFGELRSTFNKLVEEMSRRLFYYIDKSVLVENRPLVKFIRNYIRDSSGVFSISSLVRISMTSFAALTLLFMQIYSCPYNKKPTRHFFDKFIKSASRLPKSFLSDNPSKMPG